MVSETKDRSRVHHVATTLGDPKSEDALAFSAFDVLDEDGTDAQGRPYPERFALLQKWLGEGKPALVRLGVVPTESGKPSDVAKRYRSWVLEGGDISTMNLPIRRSPNDRLQAPRTPCVTWRAYSISQDWNTRHSPTS